MAHRKNEEPRMWFRSDRVFRVDEEWFIHTREGIAVGPYSDKFAADVDAEVLKSLLAEAEGEAEAREVIEEFMQGGGRNLREIKYDAEAAAKSVWKWV
jgi:hypothetical protein